MTPQQQSQLKSIRDQVNNLAADLKHAHDQGFVVSFQIDNKSGKVNDFEVKETTKVDLDKPLSKSN